MADSAELQESVNRVFGRLEAEVQSLGGTLKEFQGDAIFGFWEKGAQWVPRNPGLRGRAPSEEDGRKTGRRSVGVEHRRHTPSRWTFALATGPVTISGYGSDGALSLSMVGESVVLAFRIEKLANKKTGPIIVCPITRKIAEEAFKFKEPWQAPAQGLRRRAESLRVWSRRRDSHLTRERVEASGRRSGRKRQKGGFAYDRALTIHIVVGHFLVELRPGDRSRRQKFGLRPAPGGLMHRRRAQRWPTSWCT